MATVDSLDIQISASAKTASASLDKLINKIGILSNALNKIDVSRISNEFAKLSKSMSGINGNAFKGFADSAKNMETFMSKLAKEASKGIKSKIIFDESEYETAIANLGKKFADAEKNIRFSGSTSQLEKQYEKLSTTLDRLIEKENKIISVGKTSPESAVFQNLQYDISSTLNQLDTLSEKIKSIKIETPYVDLSKLSNDELTEWFNNLPSVAEKAVREVNSSLSQIEAPKLAESNPESWNYDSNLTKKIYGELAENIKNWSQALNQFGQNAGIAMNSFLSSADSAKNQTNELSEKLNQLVIPPIRTTELSKLQSDLSKTEAEWEKLQAKLSNELTMGRMTESIDDKGFVKLQEQIRLTELRAEALKKKIQEVQSTSKNASGFEKLSNAMNKTSASFSKLQSTSNKATTAIKKMSFGFKNLLRTILPFLGIRELFNFGKDSIKNASDYLETLNYFDAAFGQVADRANLSAFSEMGYASADEYYNSFAKRAKELTAQMSGFAVDEKGMLQSTGAVSLGLDPNQLMNYQAMFGQMASSMGVASETSLKLSEAFTKLGADLASVKNMDFDKVWEDMASGMAGMSRTLDKYGANIRNVNLQQRLTELGIDANISALNQNDKALLRGIILLDSTRYAWGDLADTLNQPANQLRLIQANFQNLSRTIGSLFLPLAQKVLPYVNALVIALQRLASWLGNLLGIDLSGISTAIGGTDMSNLLDQTDDLEDSLGGAKSAADKLNKSLQKFDELNVISTKQDEGSGIGGLAQSGLLDAAFDDIYSEYNAKWKEAYAELDNQAQRLADKIEKTFEPIKKIIEDFAIGDFFSAGKDTSHLVAGIFDFFADAIAKVDWYGIGQKMGDFLAGIDWVAILKSVGRLIWEALKAAFEMYVGAFSAAPLEAAVISLAAMPTILKAITASKFITGFKKLGKEGKVLADSFSLLKKGISDKQFGAGLSAAIKNISKNLSPLQKASIAITGIAGEFSLVNSGFRGLTSGSENVITSLGKIVSGAGLAVGALKLIGMSNPWTAAITGAVGLAGAIVGIKQAQKEALEELKKEHELSVYGDYISNITTRLNEAAQATKDRAAASMDYVQNAGLAEMDMAKDLADRYFNLYEKEDLTNDEKDEMLRLSDLLVQKLPDLQQYYDDETGLIDTTRESVEKLIDAKLKEIQLNAAEEELTEMYKQRRTTLKNLDEATQDVSKSMEQLETAQNEYENLVKKSNAIIAYEKIGELIAVGHQNMGDFTASQELLNSLTNAGVEATGKLVDIRNKLQDVATEGGTQGFPSRNALIIEMEKTLSLIDSLKSEYDSFAQEFKNQQSTYDTVESTISDLSKIISGKMGNAGENAAESYADSVLSNASKIEDAMKKIGDDGWQSFHDSEMNFGSPSKAMIQFGEDTIAGYNEGISENVESTLNKISEYSNKVVDKFSEIISPLKEIGVNAMQGLYDGIASMESGIYRKANEIADNIGNTIKKALEIHSPSRVMFKLGDYTMQGFQEGIENLQQPILNSMKEFGQDLQIVSTPRIEDIYSVYNYSASSHMPQDSVFEYSQYGYGQNNAETNRLLREQNNLLRAILEKPSLSNGDIFNAAQAVYKGEATRRFGDSGVFDPVWG